MRDGSYLSDAVLVVTSAILLYAAFVDLRDSKIPNALVMATVLLFFLYAGLAGAWLVALQHVGLALCVFVLLVVFYSWNWAGGGDVKMLTAAYLWTGIESAFAFSLLLCIFASIHAIATRLTSGKFASIDELGRRRMPFAPSISASLILAFLLRYFTTAT